MKLPEMPGRIMAQMATAPERKMNHRRSGVSAGVLTPTHQATKAPVIRKIKLVRFLLRTFSPTTNALATMSPKKKLHNGTAWLSSR